MDIFGEYEHSTEPITLSSGEPIPVTKYHFPPFKRWNGAGIADPYGKLVLDWHGLPTFAELIVVQLLRQYEFEGVWWVDNYRCRFRQSMEAFLVPLGITEKARLKSRENKRSLPSAVCDLYERLVKANGCRMGFWDVLACLETQGSTIRGVQMDWT